MDSTFVPLSKNTAALLPNTPAQTCVALGANYKYGKQGLPDLPTRLRPKKTHTNNPNRYSACSPAGATSGPDPSKGKMITTTRTSTALHKKDMFPSSYRPYDDKILVSSALTNSAALATSKGLGRIPATLSRSSNESTTSSNSTSSTIIIDGRRVRSKDDGKKVVVIKKKPKRYSKRDHHHKGSKTSEIVKSSTPPTSAEDHEPLSHLHKNKVERSRTNGLEGGGDHGTSSGNAENGSHSKSAILAASPQDSITSTNKSGHNENFDEDGENICNKEDKTNSNCVLNSKTNSAAEKVRCTALPLLKQRLGYLWEKKMFTDVLFLVGRNRRKIEAHRVILASCSEIFQSLLYSEGKPLQSADEKYILYENDFSEPALEVFIKAMYTNEIPICLTLAMALEVFYATKKYAVIFLEDQVLEHIRQLLTVSNVFEALRFSTNAVELTYLAPICWRIVEEKTAEVLEYHLDNLEAHLFSRILERNRLSVDEVQLFQFAVRWAASLCKKNGMKVTGKNKRHFMEPLLKHFRFTTMNPTQFTEVVAPSRILEQKEIQQIQSAFHKVADLKHISLPYKTTPRVNTANQLLTDQHHSSKTTESSPRLGTPKNPHTGNMDGSGDGQQVQMISSDSVVIAPGLGSKLHYNGSGGSKRGISSTKLKNRRVPSSHSKAR